MSNTFGINFRVTTWGESHGEAIGLVIDGIPSNFEIDLDNIRHYLNLRRPGSSNLVSTRNESDEFEILSGIFNNKTTGAPISIIIKNKDVKSQDYDYLYDKFRPGHADYTYSAKYGNYDYKGGGRASARETVCRVIAGSIARQILKEQYNIEIYAELVSIMGINSDGFQNTKRDNRLFTTDTSIISIWDDLIQKVRKDGDSAAGKVRVIAYNMPEGIGEPLASKLDAQIAAGMMSIPGVKSVTIGNENVLYMKGSDYNDQMTSTGYLSNNAGGTLGGISNGNNLDISVTFKPTSTIIKPQQTIDINRNNVTIQNRGRHDPCIAIRGVVIVESILALIIIDLLNKGK